MSNLNRVPDTTAAAGLRQHSIGSTFPLIVVGVGNENLTWNVELGRYRIVGIPTSRRAQNIADQLAEVYRKDGYEACVRAIVARIIVLQINS